MMMMTTNLGRKLHNGKSCLASLPLSSLSLTRCLLFNLSNRLNIYFTSRSFFFGALVAMALSSSWLKSQWNDEMRVRGERFMMWLLVFLGLEATNSHICDSQVNFHDQIDLNALQQLKYLSLNLIFKKFKLIPLILLTFQYLHFSLLLGGAQNTFYTTPHPLFITFIFSSRYIKVHWV